MNCIGPMLEGQQGFVGGANADVKLGHETVPRMARINVQGNDFVASELARLVHGGLPLSPLWGARAQRGRERALRKALAGDQRGGNGAAELTPSARAGGRGRKKNTQRGPGQTEETG